MSGQVGNAPACYSSSQGSNPETLSKIHKMGDISKGVVNTLYPAKTIQYTKKKFQNRAVSNQLPTLERDGGVRWSLRWGVTLIKRKENFPPILGNSEGSGAKSYMTNELHMYDENICVFAHILESPSSFMTMQPESLWISLYRRKILFSFFISVVSLLSVTEECTVHTQFQ